MNDLRKRLDDLARAETRQVALSDPSLADPEGRSPVRLQVALAVAALIAVAAMLFAWQGRDSSTSIAVGEGDGGDSLAAAAQGEAGASTSETVACDIDAVLPVLRAGIPTFDYQPAGSYGALAAQSQAILRADVGEVRRAEVNGRSYIELVLENMIDLQTGEARPDVDIIAYDAAWADSSQPDPLAEPIEIDGLTVIAFASPWSGVRGGWTPGVEGLYVGCGPQTPHVSVLENAAGPNEPGEPTADVIAAVLAARAAAEAAQLAQEQTDAQSVASPKTIEEARALWELADVGDYWLRYFEFGPEGVATQVEVLVEAGRVAEVRYPNGLGEAGTPMTVRDLFDLFDSADSVRQVEFDPIYGHPTLLSVDPDATRGGDELAVRSAEVVPVALLDGLDERIDTWLAAAGPVVDPPEEIVRLRGLEDEAPVQVRHLHALSGLDIYLYRTSDSVCVTAVRPEEGSSGSCAPTTEIATRSLFLMHTPPSASPFVVVVPAVADLDAGWVASASPEVGVLDVTSHSALLVVDPEQARDAGVSSVSLDITCDCGDESKVLPVG